MIDLSDFAGIPVELDPESGQLAWGEEIAVDDVGDRRISDLLRVLAFPDSVLGRESEFAYRLHRGLRRSVDTEIFVARMLRYDITVILPGDIGGEQFKTAGHIHSPSPGGAGYPEIYDVLFGSAEFVLQWINPLRLVIVECVAGDRILIPGGAGHLTINHGSTPLVVANLVGTDSANDYGVFQTKQGAAIYITIDPNAPDLRRQLINKTYDETPTWRTIRGSRVGRFVPEGPLYQTFLNAPGEFGFLTDPNQDDPDMQTLWTENRPEG